MKTLNTKKWEVVFLILLVFILSRCSHKEYINIEIGNRLDTEDIEDFDSVGVMISAADMVFCKKIKHEGIEYLVHFTENNKINYIQTDDINFRTGENFGRQTTLGQVKVISNSGLIKYNGWAYFTLLPSGWCAAFIAGHGTVFVPQDSMKVSYYFKR